MVEQKTGDDATAAPVSLEILTGPARGTASWLSGATLDISLNPADMIRIAEAGSEPLENGVVARLHRSADSYEIEALEDNPLWINGTRIDSKRLEQRAHLATGRSRGSPGRRVTWRCSRERTAVRRRNR